MVSSQIGPGSGYQRCQPGEKVLRLCFDVIKDLLDDVGISDVGDDTQGTAA